MLEKSMGLLFFLKQPRNYQGGEMYIYLRITVDGVPKELSTKMSWSPERWDARGSKALGNKEDARTINNMLETLHAKAHEARRSMIDAGKRITAQAMKDHMMGVAEKKRTILEVFKQHNDRMSTLVGTEYSSGTLDRFTTSMQHTSSFMQWRFGRTDMDVIELDHEFVSDYAFWLKSERKCNHNSTMKYLGNFKKIVIICMKNRWIQYDPFADFKLTKKKTIKQALTPEELQRIIDKKLQNERLETVRDLFLFSCYTGLAYIDIKQLRPTDIGVGIDGGQWIFSARQKTDVPVRIPLLPQAITILQKYADHPECVSEGVALPVLSNQKMNSYLQEIGDRCEIKIKLTFHLARHIFATTILRSNGVPIETVSKLLGHSTVIQTEHYAKLLDARISQDMQELRQKLASREVEPLNAIVEQEPAEMN